ncbi:MAG TPA: response regulator [Terracidiphilus sp.]|nr:response regulator [Terracidiphilus sp.]
MSENPTLLHVCGRDMIRALRDQIFRMNGYEVESTESIEDGLKLATTKKYSLVIIDVEGDGRVPAAEKLCSDVKKHRPDQNVVFICNYRVSVHTDCPDEIIRSEFNPQAMLDGVKAALDNTPNES